MGVFAALVLLAVPLVVASCGKDRIAIKPKPPVIGDDIVFTRWEIGDENTHLFVINADGTGLHQLTTDSLDDFEPRWSPDGSKIAFIRVYSHFLNYDAESANVSVINADGTDLVRLTRELRDSNPSWSTDGSQISYQRPAIGGVWAMNSDGTNPHLFMPADSTGGAAGVTWTTQGTLLGYELFGLTMQLSPSATHLTRFLRIDYPFYSNPRLSPDGTTIAFCWAGPYGSDGPYIYTVKTDGTDMKQLTHGHDKNPIWSPDGSKIAYINEDFQIWTMNADGTNAAQLTTRTSFGSDDLGDWK